MREPLVLLPGMMCDARLFGPQIAELSAEFAVTVAPITQGERVEEIASGLLDLLPNKFALAGLSMGGIVAMELMRRAPDRVTRIALMDTNPLAETPQSAATYEPMIVGARAGRLGDILEGFMKPEYLAPSEMRGEILALTKDMGLFLGPEVFVRQARALQRRGDQQGTLRKCKVPALVMCGEHDALTPVKRHTFMAELIPYAKLQIIEGAGHLPTLEQPAATTAALREWMTQPYVLK
ncbi:alpha/beta fold hydrolase [Shimia thalassica]|uniref:alpha/beta fold hydrolase n=1 Tax=Shimia thalassica TaxID=1715693 RepID=UPI000C070FCF|nr:alpha/beta fold hydrolase [Shimia thalassica]PHO02293.1 alpha/beta hydrolase [Rhodobacteraceae bacterium 4F10]MBU2943962.1 alpha/beta hydrolase [Shimia thalassica]MDO6503473.1 alpha/beta fold hydrolase [Shimia thalassica]MDO6521120.1 alpha/beta fold hydrolase [Shimia thalassica]MDP2494851.1 alpha/beta fold hydrolase [Shimia thalassica]